MLDSSQQTESFDQITGMGMGEIVSFLALPSPALLSLLATLYRHVGKSHRLQAKFRPSVQMPTH